jgi:hemolysin D
LLRERERYQAARSSAERQVEKLEAILPIVSRRARDQRGLAEQKLLAEQQYLEVEQRRLEVLHDLRTQQGRIDEFSAALTELDARLEATDRAFALKLAERLDEVRRRHADIRQQRTKAEASLRAHTVMAPVDGIVQQLAIHHAGAVVTPAQALMVLVPEDAGLVVEAVLENKDIGFVEVGQAAEIKVDTFPFTRYGTVNGRVIGISGDAVADEQKGLVYTMRVSLDASTMSVNGRDIPLVPGMTVTVESITGTRRLIEYVLSPLLRYRDESVRER